MTPLNLASFRENARRALLDARGPMGHWVGELSSSALSTATALFTLSTLKQPHHAALITNGLKWLAATQNVDGGWGDTTKSFSNISTTALCWAAFGVPESTGHDATVHRVEAWLKRNVGSLDPVKLAQAIVERYGKDHTFSVPILTMMALAGKLGDTPWHLVPQLPFELAACPFQWFQWLQLPVVSYALPALIAIGQVKHHHKPTRNPVLQLLRNTTHARTLRKLREIQPTTGGYLEATPLTSFVCMSLIAAGQSTNPVVTHGVEFLTRSALADGSWPIDTNLATWVTTLSVNALNPNDLGDADRTTIRDWLLNQQYRVRHPYTHAAPGGWAWTDLSGGVPDADDTPSALLALAKLGEPDTRTLDAVHAGVVWLLNLQNRDGGIPTFCRGWTGLPFDRSSNDLTAHAIRAWATWNDKLEPRLQKRIVTATERAINYLIRTQGPDGAWAPLWFGNQHATEIENLTYGTSRVLKCTEFNDLATHKPRWASALTHGYEWLQGSQNSDGGWGGRIGTPSSIEETALALDGLLTTSPEMTDTVQRGLKWLSEATHHGTHFPPTPIGFYFANLWYFENLYPLIYTNAALLRCGKKNNGH